MVTLSLWQRLPISTRFSGPEAASKKKDRLGRDVQGVPDPYLQNQTKQKQIEQVKYKKGATI